MADIAELIVALKLRDGLSGGLGNLNRQLRGMQGGLSDVGRGIGQVGSGLDRIVTRGAIAAAAGLGAVVTAAVSFEDAFAGVRKTVDASESDLESLEDRLREMARSMPVSFQELAGIAEAGGALGIAFEGLDEFTDTVAKLAATTDLSADQAATSLGVLGNVLSIQAEDFDNFGSALVDLGNKGASTESQILGIAERAGAAGQLIGLSADQVLGFGAAAANMGIEVEAGGSALQRFFVDALTAVEGGGKDLETFARTAGQSATEFQKSFRDDAGGALADFVQGLGELPEAVQIQTLQDLGFNDVRISRLLLGLASDFDNLEDSMQISAEAFAANSALGAEAEKRFKTTASQLQILKQNVTDAAVVIGSELLPVIGELTGEFVEFINQPQNQRALKDFGENLAGGIRSFADEIRKADFGPLLDTMKGAAAIAKGAFDAFRSLPQPIQQLALAALVANKVTGGAVGSIAAGLGNILRGVIKIGFERGSSPVNPLFVSAVGGGLGGPGGIAGTGGGGILGTILKGAGVLAAAQFAAEFGDEINRAGIDVHDALGIADPPPWLSDFLHWSPFNQPTRGGASGSFSAPGLPSLPHADPRGRAAEALEKAAESFDRVHLQRIKDAKIILPDTAMRPVTTEVQKLPPILLNNRADAAAKLLGVSAKIATTNVKLDTANARLGMIAGKNFGTIVNKTQISSTVIQQRTVQTRVISGTRTPTPY